MYVFIVEGLKEKSPHHNLVTCIPETNLYLSFSWLSAQKCLITSSPALTLHKFAPPILSLYPIFCFSLRIAKLSSSLRKPHTEVSRMWADTMCHNFQILMLGSWQRPTHSEELQGPWSHWCDSFSCHNILLTILPDPVGIYHILVLKVVNFDCGQFEQFDMLCVLHSFYFENVFKIDGWDNYYMLLNKYFLSDYIHFHFFL